MKVVGELSDSFTIGVGVRHEKNRYQETRWSIMRVSAELRTTTSTLHVREQDRKDQGFLPTFLSLWQHASRKQFEEKTM